MRRELAQTLFDLAAIWEPARSPLVDIAPRSLKITQPIELRMKFFGAEPVMLADAPSSSWTTGFDDQASTLRVSFATLDDQAALIALADFADGATLADSKPPLANDEAKGGVA